MVSRVDGVLPEAESKRMTMMTILLMRMTMMTLSSLRITKVVAVHSDGVGVEEESASDFEDELKELGSQAIAEDEDDDDDIVGDDEDEGEGEADEEEERKKEKEKQQAARKKKAQGGSTVIAVGDGRWRRSRPKERIDPAVIAAAETFPDSPPESKRRRLPWD